MADYPRYTILDVVVTHHERLWLNVQMPTGAPGWIPDEYLDDVRVEREHWPEIGSVLRAVVLDGPKRGRYWLSARPSVFEAARQAGAEGQG
jgi:hypothetical protein